MSVQLIDTHAHLDMAEFDNDRDDVIRRAADSGVSTIITAGTDLASSQKAIELAFHYQSVFAAAGIHPQESTQTTEADIASIANLVSRPGIVAIGEIGLDFHRDYAPHEQQIRVLKWQLALAGAVKKPVIIHSREAESEIQEILAGWRKDCAYPAEPAGVIHCFSGTLEVAQTYLRLGFYLSLGAYVGYPSSRMLRNVVRQLPLDRLLIETDCPFLPPQDRRGKRNEPAYVVETAKELAKIKEMSVETIAAQTSSNVTRLFGICPPG